MSLGSRIKQARAARGLTQEALGQLIDAHRVTVAKYEKEDGLTLDSLRRIAAKTDFPMAWFFLEDGYELVYTASKQDLAPLQRALEKASELQAELLKLQDVLSK